MSNCQECDHPVHICSAITYYCLGIQALQVGNMQLYQEFMVQALIELGSYCEGAGLIFDLESMQCGAAVN